MRLTAGSITLALASEENFLSQEQDAYDKNQ